MPAAISMIFVYAISIALVVAVIYVVRTGKQARETAIAAGLCPTCIGEGSNFSQMNGLMGCVDCDGSGTLGGHNALRHAHGLRKLA